ncbi:MAG TPA: hypothetical protein VJ548_12850 [Azospira sp.]|nr:hypothetical protein [Azospira sp.]
MRNLSLTALALALAAAFPAQAAGNATGDAQLAQEVKQMREQLQQMQAQYERRIQSLESRLAQAETQAGSAEKAAAQAQSSAAEASEASKAAAQNREPARSNAFNPDISLILTGTYNNLKQRPETYQITGFTPTLGAVGPGSRGFSLGETELVLTANVDPDWRGTAIASLKPEGGVDMENAFIESLGLGHGLNLKAGRFYSGLGYLNEQHAHAWDFVDAPLAYKAFLGNQFAQDGVQLRWLAPTDTFLELGLEAGRGQSFPSTNRDKNGTTSGVAFAHLGGDIGASNAWRAGLSYLGTSPRDRAFNDTDSSGAAVSDSFSGKSRLWVLDGVWKWAPNGNADVTNFTLQGEYFRRRESGDLASTSLAGSCAGACSGGYSSAQSGWYLQGVYQFMPRWRAGLRHDQLNYGSVNIGLADSGVLGSADFPVLASHNPTRNTLMLDYSPSEFSRFRLQLARDESGLGRTDNQIFLQYIQSLGTHGAHKF